jgi:hypothetical protein
MIALDPGECCSGASDPQSASLFGTCL